jgi:hypothetical protein
MADFDLRFVETGGATGMDSFFASEPSIVSPVEERPKVSSTKKPAGRVKVGSLSQLNGFQRVAEDTLIHKSTRDLWAIQKESDGEFYIERLFQDDGNPLKE